MTVEELAARYKIGENSLRARLAYLGLELKDLDKGGLDQLDALDEHLGQGKPLASFSYAPIAEVVVVPAERSIVRAGPEVEEAGPEEMIDLSGLERLYGFLQKAVDQGWHLPTSVVRNLVGSSPRGRLWTRFGFAFVAASRHGAEKAWRVVPAPVEESAEGS
jgi:hypothetical protein